METVERIPGIMSHDHDFQRNWVSSDGCMTFHRECVVCGMKFLDIPLHVHDETTILFAPEDGNIYPTDGSFETIETDLVKSVVKPGDFCLDIGANIGWYACLMSELVGEHGRVIAFEPNQEMFNLLRRNTFHAKCLLGCYNTALSDAPDVRPLFVDVENCGDSRLRPGQGISKPLAATDYTIGVELLDWFGFEQVNFMKIDVQGEELAVLKGAEKTLRESPNLTMLIEISDLGNAEETRSFLEKRGFVLTTVTESPANSSPRLWNVFASRQKGGGRTSP